MPIDLASASPEDLKPIADLMLGMPLEKRGEIPLRVQRAAREFLAKSESAQRVAASLEKDPVRQVVFAVLAKQLDAPAPTIDPLKREALGTLVKAVTAGAKASLGKGLASAIGAKLGLGRSAGMSAMMAGARQGKNTRKAMSAKILDRASDTGYAGATRGMPASAARHSVGVKGAASARAQAASTEPRHAVASGRAAGADARYGFQRKTRRTKQVAAAGGVLAGAAAIDVSRARRTEKSVQGGGLAKGMSPEEHLAGQKKREKKWAKRGAAIGAGISVGANTLAYGVTRAVLGRAGMKAVGSTPGRVLARGAMNAAGAAGLWGAGGWGAARLGRKPYSSKDA